MDALGKKLFKTSVVGGFNREDVYAYIESLINQHNAEVAGLRNELKGATAKNVEAAEKIGDLSAQLTELENKRKELAAAAEDRQALAQKAEELEARNQELGVGLREKEQVLTQLHGELAKLRHRIAGYENLEEEYTSNKSRLAELELSALARASELENQAQARGRELEEQAASAMKRMNGKSRKTGAAPNWKWNGFYPISLPLTYGCRRKWMRSPRGLTIFWRIPKTT